MIIICNAPFSNPFSVFGRTTIWVFSFICWYSCEIYWTLESVFCQSLKYVYDQMLSPIRTYKFVTYRSCDK
jgi:hypothetical protein